MFELNTKNLLIAGAIAVTATAAVVGTYMWFNRDVWDQEKADQVIHDLLDIYNESVAEWPSDKAKASLAYGLAAGAARRTFVESNARFEKELTEWMKRFDAEHKVHTRAFQKA